MAESKSEDWLPPGWTVKVKVRDNGRKDKYYYAPSNGPTFNSRVEVSRYLGTALNNHHQPKEKNKGTLKQAEKVVLVEKVKAEGLPPGWIKEIRITKRANTIRRDLSYIDPISKTAFRSMKAVYHYLETEELEMAAQKSKGSRDKDLEDNKTFVSVLKLGYSRLTCSRDG
ncbi:Methyl-CpG DNA binding [Trema orientale]|uniref:Methyl-CpG DNA binding n=1 Tax=Trema orientale TaxID=63057 RepID=A0A2P5CZF8_TREOI|nr:Methyl-CpG DNA binding [Trema orientale]